jgi:hypothetical protein
VELVLLVVLARLVSKEQLEAVVLLVAKEQLEQPAQMVQMVSKEVLDLLALKADLEVVA